MKNLITSISFLSIIFWISIGFGQEIELKLDQITAVIKSSKVGFEDTYLFIGRVVSINDVKQDTQTFSSLIQKGEYVEVLADKDVCYDEVYLAFLYDQKFTLSIANVQSKLVVPKPKNQEYKLFLSIKPVRGESRLNASCKLTKF